MIEIDCKLDKGASLSLHQGGIVQVFDITNPNSPSLITLLKSDRPYSDFGAKVKVCNIIYSDSALKITRTNISI